MKRKTVKLKQNPKTIYYYNTIALFRGARTPSRTRPNGTPRESKTVTKRKIKPIGVITRTIKY